MGVAYCNTVRLDFTTSDEITFHSSNPTYIAKQSSPKIDSTIYYHNYFLKFHSLITVVNVVNFYIIVSFLVNRTKFTLTTDIIHCY